MELPSLSELQHDKTNKMTCAPSKDSDQPAHQPSAQSDLGTLWVAQGPILLYADNEDSDRLG